MKNKDLLLTQLRKTPIVQIACDKAGIGRATYYRWRKDDETFAAAANQAIHDGSLLVNDMAESQLMAAIRDQNMTAIIFWLRHHHPDYTNKLDVTTHLKHLDQELTLEQQAVVEEALRLATAQLNQSTEESNGKSYSTPSKTA